MLIGIKAEPGALPDGGTGPGGGAGDFKDSDDIVVNDIRWLDQSRISFLKTTNVQILNRTIQRSAPVDGQTPCMAEPGGGPQFNSGNVDGGSVGHIIDNFVTDSTGDDSIAFFNGSTATIAHSALRNSFSKRCINSEGSPGVTVDSYTQSHTENCRSVFQ